MGELLEFRYFFHEEDLVKHTFLGARQVEGYLHDPLTTFFCEAEGAYEDTGINLI